MTILCASLVCLLRLLEIGTPGFYPPFGSHLWACFSINWPITHRLIVGFWFSFVNYVLVYSYAYVFVRLCLDVYVVHVVYVALLCIGHDSCYAVSSSHWVAPQHILGPPVV